MVKTAKRTGKIRRYKNVTETDFVKIKEALKSWDNKQVAALTGRSTTTIKHIAECTEFDEYRAVVRSISRKYNPNVKPLNSDAPVAPPIPDEQPKPEENPEPVVAEVELVAAMRNLTSELRSVANELRLARVNGKQRKGVFSRG